jgi:L-rhamnose mutarotase
MKIEGIQQKGHLQFLVNLVNDVNEFHLKLMETRKVQEYVQNYVSVAGLITELKIKSNVLNNNIFISLEAVYGYLLLKIQKKEITAETQEAMESIVGWLNHLSALYKDYEEEKLELE